MSATDTQLGGTHYLDMGVQPWDAMQAWMTPMEFRGFLRGNAIKYVARAGKKGDEVEDLRKARHYLDRLIEELEGATGGVEGSPESAETAEGMDAAWNDAPEWAVVLATAQNGARAWYANVPYLTSCGSWIGNGTGRMQAYDRVSPPHDMRYAIQYRPMGFRGCEILP